MSNTTAKAAAIVICILSSLVSLGTFCLVLGSGQNWLTAVGSSLFALVGALIAFFLFFGIILGLSNEEEEEDEDFEEYEEEEDETDSEGDEVRP